MEFTPRGHYPPSNFIEGILTSKALLNPLEGLNYFTSQGEPNISYKFEHCSDGFGYFLFDNQSRGTTLTATVVVEGLDGCEFGKFFSFWVLLTFVCS